MIETHVVCDEGCDVRLIVRPTEARSTRKGDTNLVSVVIRDQDDFELGLDLDEKDALRFIRAVVAELRARGVVDAGWL